MGARQHLRQCDCAWAILDADDRRGFFERGTLSERRRADPIGSSRQSFGSGRGDGAAGLGCERLYYRPDDRRGRRLAGERRGKGMTPKKKPPEQLRSHRWFAVSDLRAFGHRARAKQMGYSIDDFAGKPVIGIIHPVSDLTSCHTQFRTGADEVKRGVWQAGGFPVELPAMPVNETYMKPSPMMYRNLLAMETEELIRSQPIDGVVLMGGCDKTVPGLLMAGITMNLPAIYLAAGPMLRGHWNGQVLGSGTDQWKDWAEKC